MTSWPTVRNQLPLYLFVISTMSCYVNAQPINHYFESDDSAVFKNKDVQSSNREDSNPVVTIRNFDIAKLKENQPNEINHEQIEALIAADLKQNNQRYTIDRLHQLSDQLTNYYRSKGYILSKVYFPEQSVKNNTLYLDIVYGKLEKVTAHKQDHYSGERLTRPFQDIIGQPTHISTLESSLLELSQYPGVTVKSQFRQGDDIGNTQIDIFVTEEKVTDFNFSFDNYGSEYTGSMRGMLSADVYNIADMADRLSLNLLATIDPANSLYIGANYSFRWSPYFTTSWLSQFFRHGIITRFGYQESQYSVGGDFKLAKIDGEADTTYVGISKHFILKNNLQLNGGLTLSKKQATSFQNNRAQIEDSLTIATVTSTLQWNDHIGSPSASAVQLDIHRGLPGVAGAHDNNDAKISRTGTSLNKAPMDFTKYNLILMRNQAIGPYQLLTKLRFQHTDDLLLSSELSNLGGVSSVRGYSTSDFSGDRSSIATLEISGKANASKFILPISSLKLAAFFDYGKGKRLEPNRDVLGEAEMASIGGYAEFIKDGKFSSKIELAMPLKDAGESSANKFEVLFNFDRGF
ncbi:ShlB/FhaC/HecB family hemolysin secretion/activation protein [Pseudomonas sp. HK3]